MSHPGHIIPQDVLPADDEDDVLTALPVTPAEIDELVYGEDSPAAERLARLQELRAILANEQPGDIADYDATTLLAGVDDGIARLSGGLAREDDGGVLDAAIDNDPSYHRETLSPDSDELLEIEDEDEASVTGTDADDDEDDVGGIDVLDPKEWDDVLPKE